MAFSFYSNNTGITRSYVAGSRTDMSAALRTFYMATFWTLATTRLFLVKRKIKNLDFLDEKSKSSKLPSYLLNLVQNGRLKNICGCHNVIYDCINVDMSWV